MRLKTFHGKSMQDVMQQLRASLGPDAIIISTDESPAGFRITAAAETTPTPEPPSNAPEPRQTPLDYERSHIASVREFDEADIRAVFTHHAVPDATASRLTDAVRAVEAVTLTEALSSALDSTIAFSPLTDTTTRPVMLVGPAGAGKTICAAKLTADALLHEKKVQLVTTDTVKAGGVAQLDHFAALMKQTVSTADTPNELEAVVKRVNGGTFTIIDTPGTNPFDMQELEQLLHFIKKVDAEPVLVMPAGLDPTDAQEIAGIYSQMGCRRFIVTRLDASRRYAGVISAARPGFLALAAFSRSPYIAEGLETAGPESLARLLAALPRNKTKLTR